MSISLFVGIYLSKSGLTGNFLVVKRLLKELDEPKIKILAGILPLRSYKMAMFLNENVPGVTVPDKILKRIKEAKDPEEEGISISIEIIEELKPLCAGIHLMTLNNIEVIPEILNRLKF